MMQHSAICMECPAYISLRHLLWYMTIITKLTEFLIESSAWLFDR